MPDAPFIAFSMLAEHVSGRAWDMRRVQWDWCSPATVCWIQLVAPARASGELCILLGLADDAPAGRIGSRLRMPDSSSVRLRVARSRPPSLNGNVPAIAAAREGAEIGTVGALMVDRRGQFSALTCAHVLAGRLDARVNAAAVLSNEGRNLGQAHLCAWLPANVDPERAQDIDAALAAISPDQARALAQRFPFLLPEDFVREREIAGALTVRTRTAPLVGEASGLWAGRVNLPGGGGASAYMELLSYFVAPSPRPGDSGAGVWDAAERLVGIHCAGADEPVAGSFNALLCPIERIVQRLVVRPVLRTDVIRRIAPLAGSASAIANVGVGKAAEPSSADDLDILARTLWGEAGHESEAFMQAVASVVMNRVLNSVRHPWLGRTVREVCTGGGQFPCWQPQNSLYARMIGARPDDDAFARALAMARRALARRPPGVAGASGQPDDRLDDNTDRSTRYCPTWLAPAPAWAKGRQPCVTIGPYAFYNNVD